MVARPQNLDTACTLALLQEEAANQGVWKEYKCLEGSLLSRNATIKGALPLPPPPPRLPLGDQHNAGRPVEERRAAAKTVTVDDKLATLRSYCKAHGLSVRYGEKWAPSHRCAPEPQVHALHEVWALCAEAFQDSDQVDVAVPETVDPDHVFMLLSSATMSRTASPCTMQFQVHLQGQHSVILVDSGSSHSFLSSAVASSLHNIHVLPQPMSVCVADGGSLCCNAELKDAEWFVQGFSFHSTLRVLPLGSYNMILGMDWLEAFSPMKVDWRNKWMIIPYGSNHV